MFIRRNKNSAGNIAIQVVKKTGRKNTIIRHIGTANNSSELSQLETLAQNFIDHARIRSGVLSLFDNRFEQSELDKLLTKLTFIQALDTLTFKFLSYFYHLIGFTVLDSERFEDLVLARIADPLSKKKTRDLLEYRFGKTYTLSTIYRTLRICSKSDYQKKVEVIVKKFVKEKMGIRIAILFFDVTTLYYEAFDEDDTRKCGFSKEHKHNQPQIVVALTVTTQGIPLSMKMFEGNTYEGHTILPCISEVIQRFGLSFKRIVVVADAAMLNKHNLKELEDKEIKYIVGARLGNISDELFQKIIKEVPRRDHASRGFKLTGKRTLIVGYSTKRAKKDKFDRTRRIKKAEEILSEPSSIMRRYKYITTNGKDTYSLNQELIKKAESLEGLKGYVTNAANYTHKVIIDRYTELWQVEKAFRMSKSDLKARPIFHTLKESIQAHLLIVFTALVISRYVELITHKSIEKVIQILNLVKEVIVEDNLTKQRSSKYTNFTDEAKELARLAKITWVT